MSAIVRQHEAAATVNQPGLSARLSNAVDVVQRPHPDIGQPKAWPATIKAEAEAAAAQLAPMCRPPTPRELRDWVRPLGAAVRNPPADTDFAAWCAALAVACSAHAVGAFSALTQREALQQFQFWPAVADICKLVGAGSIALKSKLDALRRIVAAETLEPRPKPTGGYRTPLWVADRTIKVASEGEVRESLARAPIRTVEEQLAQLGVAK